MNNFLLVSSAFISTAMTATAFAFFEVSLWMLKIVICCNVHSPVMGAQTVDCSLLTRACESNKLPHLFSLRRLKFILGKKNLLINTNHKNQKENKQFC